MTLTVQRTERECSECEDGVYYKYDHDLICGDCHHAPDGESTYSGVSADSPWEDWWEHRTEYDGFYGEDRVRMVGGFRSAYP